VSTTAQMLIVTHNKKTMELAERLYGVTMQEPGVSSIISTLLSDAVAVVDADDAPPLANGAHTREPVGAYSAGNG
jgi:hypothetical protein